MSDGIRTPGQGRRYKISATLHPVTVERLAELTARFKMPVGRIIDRLVEVLYTSYADGKVRCIHGSTCVAGRQDLPTVL